MLAIVNSAAYASATSAHVAAILTIFLVHISAFRNDRSQSIVE
jgi:hypothetical protein